MTATAICASAPISAIQNAGLSSTLRRFLLVIAQSHPFPFDRSIILSGVSFKEMININNNSLITLCDNEYNPLIAMILTNCQKNILW